MKYTIFTDTSANLPGNITEQYNIKVVPLTYCIGGEEKLCLNPTTFDAAAYYGALKGKVAVTTSLASVQSFLNAFEPELQAGNDILYIGMSSGISGTCQSAANAAAELAEQYPERGIFTVDTLAASLAEGLFVLDAIKLREQEVSIEETARILRDSVQQMLQVFTVEDLGYLHRGGRISGVSAIIGSVLHVNPILVGNEEGKIIVKEKVRGRKKALDTLVQCYNNNVASPEEQTVCISHCGCPDDALRLAQAIDASNKPREILIENFEPVTGSHVGPGAIALFFKGNSRKYN